MLWRRWLFWFSSLLMASHLAQASDVSSAPEPSFFIDKRRGWFWWELPPSFVEAPTTAPAPSPLEAPARTESPPSTMPNPANPPFSAAWFRHNLETYRDRAIDDPSPANVAAYFYLQRVMLDKAQRFTDVARHVVMADPWLDENQRRPIATFAANAANQQAAQVSERALASIARQAGLLFFFRSDCPYCQIEAPLLASLEQRFGFSVYAVSLDGKALPGGWYADFHVDRGQAQSLGVVSTPALFLMKPPQEVVQLSQGALSLDELSGRILLTAHDAGWIDAATFAASRGQQAAPSLVPSPSLLTAEAINDPITLIQTLQSQAGLDSAVLTPVTGAEPP